MSLQRTNSVPLRAGSAGHLILPAALIILTQPNGKGSILIVCIFFSVLFFVHHGLFYGKKKRALHILFYFIYFIKNHKQKSRRDIHTRLVGPFFLHVFGVFLSFAYRMLCLLFWCCLRTIVKTIRNRKRFPPLLGQGNPQGFRRRGARRPSRRGVAGGTGVIIWGHR